MTFYLQAFSDGLMVAKTDLGWGYVNKSGEEVIKCEYDDAYPFEDWYEIVKQKELLYLIDTKG